MVTMDDCGRSPCRYMQLQKSHLYNTERLAEGLVPSRTTLVLARSKWQMVEGGEPQAFDCDTFLVWGNLAPCFVPQRRRALGIRHGFASGEHGLGVGVRHSQNSGHKGCEDGPGELHLGPG